MNCHLVLSTLVFSSLYCALVQGMSTCNDDCLSKTYCLSIDGTDSCSGGSLVQVKFSVNELVNNDYVDLLNITLIGYSIRANESRTLALQFYKDSTQMTTYSCTKTILGATSATVTSGNVTYQNGSSFYLNGVFYCTWILLEKDDTWPIFQRQKVNLVTDASYKLVLKSDSMNHTVARDTKQLPIYHRQFLNCCHIVHGNEDYQLIVSQSDTSADFYLQTLETHPINWISASFNFSEDRLLVVQCYFQPNSISGHLQTGKQTENIDSQLYSKSVEDSRCYWSQPLTIKSNYEPLDTRNGVFNLRIISDNIVVYSENNVPLKGAVSPLLANSLIIVITLLLSQLVIS